MISDSTRMQHSPAELTRLTGHKLMFSMSEKELGKKWDRCLADGAIKLGTGLGLGIVLSVIFFKRHTWPIAFGSGAGLGMAYANCQNDLRSHYLLHRREKE
ncbi:MICOS complex subunit MIC10 [Cynoglossus semilaevis]|uniref:MICOS complex subunit MIC10 n=1 Tax=Cynoglossus semilaevis TaxID=244447 RepID=A0A3P8UNP8_CYNSE|nr:MICOS complex subunit MIC10 [Cynoglossus semilaevis]